MASVLAQVRIVLERHKASGDLTFTEDSTQGQLKLRDIDICRFEAKPKSPDVVQNLLVELEHGGLQQKQYLAFRNRQDPSTCYLEGYEPVGKLLERMYRDVALDNSKLPTAQDAKRASFRPTSDEKSTTLYRRISVSILKPEESSA